MIIDHLKEHYKNNYQTKIFKTRLSTACEEAYVMYIYNYEEELENFKKSFLYYLPFYVKNNDFFDIYSLTEDLDIQLENTSKIIKKNSQIIPHRDISNNGIYGELFLDFYLRIVKEYKAYITYADKRDYKDNRESRGIDNVAYYIDRNKINVCFCEAKFVSNIYYAKNEIKKDIEGNDKIIGHLTEEYINSYLYFITEKIRPKLYEDDKLFYEFLQKVNKNLNEGSKYLKCLKDENVCVNFVFFAIFNEKLKNPVNLLENYEEIKELAIEKINNMKITDYKIEIIFIPTNNTTIEIKKEIEKSYE